MIIRSFYFRVTLLFYVYNAMLLNFLGGDGVKGNIGSLISVETKCCLGNC